MFVYRFKERKLWEKKSQCHVFLIKRKPNQLSLPEARGQPFPLRVSSSVQVSGASGEEQPLLGSDALISQITGTDETSEEVGSDTKLTSSTSISDD